MASLEFAFRTGRISINYDKCRSCESYACVSACAKYGANLFRIEDGKPVLQIAVEDAPRRCIEDLSCQIYCHSNGNKGLEMTLDMFGLNEYREKIGLA